jgi:hypothetical protein
MAIPDKPESRAEMYLNKIASGSGTIPAQPESRLEQYLDAIARNGGGGSGGGSGGGVLVVNLTFDEDAGYLVFDKTWSEVNAASAAVAYFDMSAFGGRGAWRLPIGDTDVIGSGDGSFTYRVFAMKMDFGTMDDGSNGVIVGGMLFTTNSTDGYPSLQFD